ncbi:MAG: hypothetical protein JNM82_11680, partial [Rhodocyclaceae bacterium]|nr:hypothetical protein [Rhodocyclaceae bacterium]
MTGFMAWTALAAGLAAGTASAAEGVGGEDGDAGGGFALRSRVVLESHGLRADSPFAPGLAPTGFGRDRARFEQEA